MDKVAVDITERLDKGKNMQLFRCPPYLPLLVLACWAVLHGVDGTCGTGGDCKNGGTCTSDTCVCDGTGYEGATCENDIDECTDGTHNCHANADCTDTDGSFTCKCKDGHDGDGVKCTDCTENGNECLNDGTCDIPSDATAGTCSCKNGYSGRICEDDINECTATDAPKHDCHKDADCTNTIGSFICTCKSGFDGDGKTCTDIDECTDGTDNCHENADCTDTEGSFTCECKADHVGDGVECERTVCTADGNECLNGGSCNIPSGGTAGTCSCESGYSGPLCADDIDECTDGTDNCHENADCSNTEGSFTCKCKDGHVGNGVECEPSGAAAISVHLLLLTIVATLAKLNFN